MVAVDVKKLIEAGVHFGHRASRWHPRMERYIYGKHNQIHIIDLRETVRGIIRAAHFLSRVAEAGHEIVFVGTKPQAREVVRATAERSGMHFVVSRWLGGTLTNFNTIRSRLRRLEELEALEADGSINLRSKKEVSRLRRERRKIHRNLEGIRKMTKLPGALVLVDTRRDQIAVAEAHLLGIPVIAICDTDTDPTTIDLPIPGNDDAYRAIEVILTALSDAILSGRDKLVARQQAEEKKRQEEQAAKEKEAKRKAEAKKSAEEGASSSAGKTTSDTEKTVAKEPRPEEKKSPAEPSASAADSSKS